MPDLKKPQTKISAASSPATGQFLNESENLSSVGQVQRVPTIGLPLSASDVQVLQRMVGNHVVQRMLAVDPRSSTPSTLEPPVIQPMRALDRQEEREEKLMDRIDASTIHSNIAHRTASGTAAARQPKISTLSVQRAANLVQNAHSMPIDRDVESSIQAARGQGHTLDKHLQAKMGQSFGTSFHNVKIHTDARADLLNRKLSANAFTVGSDIFFRKGNYQPGVGAGQKLLAHELTHVVQQGADSKPNTAQRKITLRSHAAPVIQRFSHTDKPLDWDGVDRISKSRGGQRGVYFADKGGVRVVFKLEVDDMNKSVYSDRLINTLGLVDAPGSRLIFPKDPLNEFTRATTAVLRWSKQQVNTQELPPNRIVQDAEDDVKTTNLIIVMQEVRGTEFEDLAKKPENHRRLETALKNAAIQTAIGKMIVTDAFLGNSDRVFKRGGATNIGNFMLSNDGQNILTIDSAAERFAALAKQQAFGAEKSTVEGRLRMVEDLFTPERVRLIANSLILTLKGNVNQPGVVKEKTNLELQLTDHEWGQIENGILQAILHYRAQLPTILKAQHGNLKQTTQEISEQYKAAGRGSEAPDYDALKVRAKYWTLRANNMGHEQAISESLVYLDYRRFKPEYQNRKRILTRIDPSFKTPYNRPPEMSKSQKASRVLSSSNAMDKRAENFKKIVRSGGSDRALEQQVMQDYQSGTAGRRTQKAVYELNLNRFMQSISERTTILRDLNEMVINLKGHASHSSENRFTRAHEKEAARAEHGAAGQKLQYIYKQFNKGDRAELLQMHNELHPIKQRWLETLNVQDVEQKELGEKTAKSLQETLNHRKKQIEELYAQMAGELDMLRQRIR